MLINILGPDGCGKSTQIKNLIHWVHETHNLESRCLTKKNIFDVSRFPECDFFGCKYEKLAHQLVPIMQKESRSLWLFYMLAVLIRRQPPLPGEVVFLDGYWQKHYASEAAMGIDSVWLLNVCSFFPDADLTILLDIDPRDIVNRGHHHKPYESGCDFSCSDESFILHQDKIRQALLHLADNEGYTVIPANTSEKEVFKHLCSIIVAKLP